MRNWSIELQLFLIGLFFLFIGLLNKHQDSSDTLFREKMEIGIFFITCSLLRKLPIQTNLNYYVGIILFILVATYIAIFRKNVFG